MKRYNDLNTYLRSLYGCRVQKITVDAGFTCPNRDGHIAQGGCIYCNAAGSGTGASQKGISIRRQLEQGKQALARRYKAKKFIAYFQSFTNTYAPLTTLKKRYDEALAVEDVVGLSIGTRPDCVDADILSLLETYGRRCLIWIEYGLQTASNRSLALLNRGHDFESFRQAVLLSAGRGLRVCAHVILGIPGETERHMMATARAIAALPVDGIKIHLMYVIKNTPLEKLYRKGHYRCLERQEYIDLVCRFLERLPAEVVVQRLTGDPHPDELVAPAWSLDKRRNLRGIQERLESLDTWQGRLCGPRMVDKARENNE